MSDDKLNEYKQRSKEWRDISINQLSYVNNVFISLTTGYLIFRLENNKIDLSINFKEEIDWGSFMSFFSIVMGGLSLIYGIGVLLSRLYDFRISRNLALTRKRFYEDKKKKLDDGELENSCFYDRIKVVLEIVFCKIDFISKNEVEKNEVEDRFNKLRRKANILGEITWIWMKCQVLFFLISVLMYVTQYIN